MGDTTRLQARPTSYRGTLMRSRLEATFAAYLDSQGERWSYEPLCYASERGQYLPDFQITQDDAPPGYGQFIEVKGVLTDLSREIARMAPLWDCLPSAEVLLVLGREKCWVLQRSLGGVVIIYESWDLGLLDGWLQ